MGLAPNHFFTGLWTYCAILVCTGTPINFCGEVTLLANVPLAPLTALAVHTDFCTAGSTVNRNHQFGPSTAPLWSAARSQFRGVGSCHLAGNALLYGTATTCWPSSLRCPLWSEGCTSTMAGMEAGNLPAKQHGEELRLTSESYQPHKSRNLILKRSYKRAINRVRQHGFTWYRGRLLSGPVQPPETSKPQISRPTSNLPAPRSRLRKRLTCFSWNTGGLSQSSWDHFQQWATLQCLDVITLQESHWGFTNEWSQDRYFCIHSGQGSSQAGVMTMISKSICKMDDISWKEVVPGRVLHVRIFGGTRSIDIINVYQHVHGPHRLLDRQVVWDELHQLIATLPKRNTWMLCGDFNTSLQKAGTAIGTSTYDWHGQRRTGPKHGDEEQLQNLLQLYGLAAVNTWKHSLGPTFQFDHKHSRIDFIICKRQLIDDCSRDVHYLTNFPLLNLNGARHLPMLCNLMKVWTPATHETAPGWSRAQRKELYLHWRMQDAQSRHLQQTLQHQLAQLPEQDIDRLTLIHETMNQYTGMNFRIAKPSPVYQHDLTPFQAFQRHTQLLRQLSSTSSTTLHTIFHIWFHVGRRKHYRRIMNQTSKAARRRRQVHIYDAAAQAERTNDPFRFYQCIRELSPKLPFRRIQLRASTGELMAPTEAADALQTWFQNLYHATDFIKTDDTCSWPFTQQELCAELNRLPAFKALDPLCAPAPFWRMTAEQTAQYLQPYLEQSICKT